jgi:hypothetical protein
MADFTEMAAEEKGRLEHRVDARQGDMQDIPNDNGFSDCVFIENGHDVHGPKKGDR